MLRVDSVQTGMVIDHMEPGRAAEVYRQLQLDRLECEVALIHNAPSRRMGRKDVIRMEDIPELDLELLGFLVPGATVNLIREGRVVEKRQLSLPQQLVNVMRCQNPRCITSIEQELDHVFRLADSHTRTYRCIYCEEQQR